MIPPATLDELKRMLPSRWPRRMKYAPEDDGGHFLAEYPPTRGFIEWDPSNTDLHALAKLLPAIPDMLAAAERANALEADMQKIDDAVSEMQIDASDDEWAQYVVIREVARAALGAKP